MIARNEDGTPVFITRDNLDQYYRQFVTRRTLYQIRTTPKIWNNLLIGYAESYSFNKFLYALKAHDSVDRFKLLLEEHVNETARPQSQQYEHFRYLSETIPPSRTDEDVQENVRQAG